jgi:hypothetical protein
VYVGGGVLIVKNQRIIHNQGRQPQIEIKYLRKNINKRTNQKNNL